MLEVMKFTLLILFVEWFTNYELKKNHFSAIWADFKLIATLSRVQQYLKKCIASSDIRLVMNGVVIKVYSVKERAAVIDDNEKY